MNLQAVCDAKRRFLSISILYGASASDLLSFKASYLRILLQRPGFLAPGLCLFGDNAYVNRAFMATPYPNVTNDTERDSYNFFHSQLWINIECAFGLLVNRWGFLRKKAPIRFSIKKTIATVSCLCHLHNFLIDQNDNIAPVHTPQDALTLAIYGAVTVRHGRRRGNDGESDNAPENDLVGGGGHFDDDPNYTIRRRIMREADRATEQNGGQLLPRECRDLGRPVHDQIRNASCHMS